VWENTVVGPEPVGVYEREGKGGRENGRVDSINKNILDLFCKCI
jgi:hypothetical protein